MSIIIYSIFPIILTIGLGYLIGLYGASIFHKIAQKSIVPLVWLLLFSIGYEFGNIFSSSLIVYDVILKALLLSLLSSFFIFVLVFYYSFQEKRKIKNITVKGAAKYSQLLKEFMIVIFSFIGGVLLALYLINLDLYIEFNHLTTILLYILLIFVGTDMVDINILNIIKTKKIVIYPILVICGSMLGGVVGSFILNENLFLSLALSSGFGWFTLSSVLVAQSVDSVYGSIALMTDLFRELIAISLLYIYGNRYPKESICIAGATALDSTLPIIKTTCTNDIIPIALFTGFTLTIVTPVMIMFFLSFCG